VDETRNNAPNLRPAYTKDRPVLLDGVRRPGADSGIPVSKADQGSGIMDDINKYSGQKPANARREQYSGQVAVGFALKS